MMENRLNGLHAKTKTEIPPPALSPEFSCPPAIAPTPSAGQIVQLDPQMMQMQMMQQMQIQMMQAQAAMVAATPAHVAISNIGAQLGQMHLQIKAERNPKPGQHFKSSFKFRAWGEQ